MLEPPSLTKEVLIALLIAFVVSAIVFLLLYILNPSGFLGSLFFDEPRIVYGKDPLFYIMHNLA